MRGQRSRIAQLLGNNFLCNTHGKKPVRVRQKLRDRGPAATGMLDCHPLGRSWLHQVRCSTCTWHQDHCHAIRFCDAHGFDKPNDLRGLSLMNAAAKVRTPTPLHVASHHHRKLCTHSQTSASPMERATSTALSCTKTQRSTVRCSSENLSRNQHSPQIVAAASCCHYLHPSSLQHTYGCGARFSTRCRCRAPRALMAAACSTRLTRSCVITWHGDRWTRTLTTRCVDTEVVQHSTPCGSTTRAFGCW